MVEVGQVLVEHCEGPSARLFSTALEVEDVGADSLVRQVSTSVGSRPILLPKSAPVPTSSTTTTTAAGLAARARRPSWAGIVDHPAWPGTGVWIASHLAFVCVLVLHGHRTPSTADAPSRTSALVVDEFT